MKSVVEKYENHAVLICQGTYKGSFIIDLDVADEVAKHSWNINTEASLNPKLKSKR